MSDENPVNWESVALRHARRINALEKELAEAHEFGVVLYQRVADLEADLKIIHNMSKERAHE